jgi:DNA-binding transcriptional LysR family regulator
MQKRRRFIGESRAVEEPVVTIEARARARQGAAGWTKLKPEVHTPAMDRMRSLRYFVETARAGSLSGAARALAVSVPAVTKGLNQLERELGVRLFDRTPRGLTLTGAGTGYLEACLPALEQLADAEAQLRAARQEVAGKVTVGVHNVIARGLLAPALPRFHALYPRIELDLRDFASLRSEAARGLDVYLVMGWGEQQDLVERKVGASALWVVATPEYLAGRGTPGHPEDLRAHACLLLRNTSGKVMDLWSFRRGNEAVQVAVNGWLTASNAHRDSYIDALLAGMGVARTTDWTVGDDVRRGRLVRVLADWESTEAPGLSVLHAPGATRLPRVRAVVDFAVALLGQVNDQRGLAVKASPTPGWLRTPYPRASAWLKR